MNKKKDESEPGRATARFERRKHPRFDIDLPIRYYKINSSLRGNGRAINASEGGLLIYFTESMELGQHLQMTLYFPPGSEQPPIEMSGDIVWTEIQLDTGWGDYRCGVNFTDISSEDITKLKDFLGSLPQ